MAIYQLRQKLELAVSQEELWDFISSPGNLEEITQEKEPHYFIDEQRAGPYSLWHHEHKLNPTEKGVLMADLVTYRPPFGPLGDLARQMFIKRQFEGIFKYREKVLTGKFGKA